MIDDQELLERAVLRIPVPAGAHARIFQARDRRRHRRRSVTVVVLLVAVACVAAGVAAVSWTGATPSFPGGITLVPVVTDKVVLVAAHLQGQGDSGGYQGEDSVYAFARSCVPSDGACPPLWHTAAIRLLSWPPAIDGSNVFVSGAGKLLAFDTSCEGLCAPRWSAVLGGGWEQSPPVVANGFVYVSAGDSLEVFREGCGSDGAACMPAWSGPIRNAGAISHVTVADGHAFVTVDDNLYSFPDSCARSQCSPDWISSLRFGCGWGSCTSAAVVSDGQVYVSVAGGTRSGPGVMHLFAFPECPPGPSCEPSWTWASAGHYMSAPVASGGMVFVVGSSTFYAFPERCDHPCRPAWKAQGAGTSTVYLDSRPVVADGIVLIGGPEGVLAFPQRCGTDGGFCSPTWIGRAAPGANPVVAGGIVYAAPPNGRRVFTFDLKCATHGGTCAPSSVTTTRGGIRTDPVIVGGVVYVGTGDSRVSALEVAP